MADSYPGYFAKAVEVIPLLGWFRVVGVAILAGGALYAGIWFNGVLAERAEYRTTNTLLLSNLKTIAAQQELAEAQQRKIAEAGKRTAAALAAARTSNAKQARELDAALQQGAMSNATLAACLSLRLPDDILRGFP